MTNMRLMPTLRYQLEYSAKSLLTMLGISVAVLILLSVLITTFVTSDYVVAQDEQVLSTFLILRVDGAGQIFSYNVAAIATVMFFVIGVSVVREDLRFFIQNGVGRRTTFVSTVLAGLVVGVVWGLFCEIMNLLFGNFNFFPGFGMIMQSTGFITGWALNGLSIFFVWQLGAMISLIYFRLGKTQKVVFTVAAIALLIFIVPNVIGHVVGFVLPGGMDAEALVRFFGNPLNIVFVALGASVITAIINFLLIRRVQITV